MSGKIFYVLALLLAVSQPAAAQQPMPAMPVSVAQVIERDVQQWHEYSGRLSAVDQVEIRSRVTGPIETVAFKDGSIVKKGDLLFTIDPRPYAAEAARAQAALLQAKATRDLDITRFRRAQSLIKDKAIAQSDYDLRKNELAVANAQVESAQAQLDAAKLNLDYTRITSPITGRVGRAELTVGNLVQTAPSSPLLTTVVSQDPIYADFDIDEATYLKFAPETTGDVGKIAVNMQLSGGAERDGAMQSFDNRLNPRSGTLRARAVFNNSDDTLVPGLFARVRVGSAGLTKAILITDRAVGTDQSKKYVYVVGADNKVEYREVKLGDTYGNLRIIADGLKAGEKIIVDGLARAHPGAEVKPELVDMEASSAAASGAPAAPAAGDNKDKNAGKAAAPAPAEDKKEGDKRGDAQGDDKKK